MTELLLWTMDAWQYRRQVFADSHLSRLWPGLLSQSLGSGNTLSDLGTLALFLLLRW